LTEDGIAAVSHNAALLAEPWTIETADGGPYKVFTPYWRSFQKAVRPDPPRDAPVSLPAPEPWPAGEALDDLGLEPRRDWIDGLAESWTPGEAGAMDRLIAFTDGPVGQYAEGRDIPARPGTSRLSPHLHFGEISPRQAWHATGLRQDEPGLRGQVEHFQRELGWREFAHHVLYHFPNTPSKPMDPRFEDFPWRKDTGELLEAWQRGRTGFPIVDAGMRQLWKTGWMHNRVRMIVASLLVKNLRIPWQAGAAWFWDTLVDADLASNTMGWQWAAGSGADAAPYFRIFNPLRQAERFDPDGQYVKTWVPELAGLDGKALRAPWQTGDHERCGYPPPVVDLKSSRQEALDAFAAIKR
jgi:deoxyribodipyrimidine photo-lyase